MFLLLEIKNQPHYSANAVSGRGGFISFLRGISNKKVAEQIEPFFRSTVERISKSSQNPIFGIVAMDYPKQDVIENLVSHNANNGRSMGKCMQRASRAMLINK